MRFYFDDKLYFLKSFLFLNVFQKICLVVFYLLLYIHFGCFNRNTSRKERTICQRKSSERQGSAERNAERAREEEEMKARWAKRDEKDKAKQATKEAERKKKNEESEARVSNYITGRRA